MVLHHRGIIKARVEKIHQAGLKAGAWTVNDPKRMKILLKSGVDRIYTDNPKLLLAILDKQ
jgi:glycerophosphoryl diester phosphodiesterase